MFPLMTRAKRCFKHELKHNLKRKLKHCLALSAFLSPLALAEQPVNIIYLVGDGMGAPYITAYRYFSHNETPIPVERTLFDAWLMGTAQTYPHDDTYVTDSAAAATSLATGVKTYNGAIGVDVNKQPVETLLERAKRSGYTTAMVVTSSVTHATPASFAAHVNTRQEAEQIADQYIDQKIDGKFKVDLLMGGGQKYFERKDRNLIKELKKGGYSYANSFKKLEKLRKLPAIGLFAEDGLPHALGSSEPLRLNKMVDKSLQLLNNPEKPFFMLIEASQIDWCGHANDIACAMGEMADLHATLGRIKTFVEQNPNTVFVMTADHSTGGLSIGANDEYIWRTPMIHRIKKTAQPIAKEMVAAKSEWEKSWLENTGITLLDSERAELNTLVEAGQKDYNAIRTTLERTLLKAISRATATGWTTYGHTGEDVLVFATGKHTELFKGNLNNIDIANQLFSLLPPQ
jgi:alkaline phosphatase